MKAYIRPYRKYRDSLDPNSLAYIRSVPELVYLAFLPLFILFPLALLIHNLLGGFWPFIVFMLVIPTHFFLWGLKDRRRARSQDSDDG